MRKGAILGAACLALPALASAFSAADPAPGVYRAAPYGYRATLVFLYSEHIHPQVSSFKIASHPPVYYSGRAFVHQSRFSWTGHTASGHELHVAGHWTSAHDVCGTIRSDGVTKQFHARRETVGGRTNGAASVRPTPGH